MAEIKTIKRQTITNNTVPLTDILYRTLHYWPWVLMSVVVCMGISVLYILKTPKVYSQSASILIKDDAKGKTTGPVDDFGDFGLFSNNTNIENEMTTFKSRGMMKEVVQRMNLDMNYYLPGRFHKMVAYGTTLPVNVTMPNYPDNSSASFHIELDKDGKLKLSGLKADDADYSDKIYSATLKDTISTAIGKIVVTPTTYYENGAPVDLTVNKLPLDAAVASYMSRLTVGMSNEKGTIIDLTFTDQNIQRADDVLATVIGVYNENWIRDKNQIAVSTSNFINERLGIIESELGNVDSDISTYKSEHLVPDVDAAATSYMAESQALGQEILGVNNQLQMTRYIRNYLNADNDNEKVLPTNTGVENLELEAQISAYNEKLLERNKIRSKSSSENPLVQGMDRELNEMRGAIIGSVDNSIVNLQTRIKSLQGARGTATSRLASNPNQAKYLLSVERQQKVKESLYLFLLQKREDNELNQAFTAYNSRLINEPGGSTAPIAPDGKRILMVAFLIGIAIPFGVVYVKETGNTKVRGRKDLENIAPPLLGEIPQYMEKGGKKSKNFDAREILVKSGSRNIINEAFRVLRTNTDFSRVNKDGCNVMVLTSFNPGSGKSFITMNLAAAIAIKDKRVLVIDGDMRHGSSSSYLEKTERGLSDYLSGESDDIMSMLVTSDDIKTLQVLPIGTVPPNPTELLESPRFGELIELMRPHYDYILIDCPPIEVVADAQIIDQYADRTIFIVRAGLLERSMLGELDRLYDGKRYRHMAVILNGTRNDRGRYGYSHSYKYGYGYGYGYGYNYESKSGRK